MKIAILSRNRNLYSTRRLREACADRGHTVKVLDTLKFSMLIEQEQPELFFRGRRLSHYDAIIPRIGSSITQYGCSVVNQFQQMGVFCANTSSAILNTRDKLRCLQILSRHDIGMAPTSFVRDRKDILNAINNVGGAPVIIKLLEGTQGVGVILAENQKIAEAIIETLHGAKQNVLVQKFVAESKGKDVRAFVVGGRVIAAMRRVAQGQEFRSNIHRGGKAEPIDLPADYERTAIEAARILGLRIAGVDMLESQDGPQVIEVNSSPGLEGIETCTGIDVAGTIVDYIAEQIDFPELDIRERLSLSAGYGVAELIVPNSPEFHEVAIRDSGIRERDMIVLTVERGESLISNPKSTFALHAGDRILCFGKHESMRDLIPKQKRKRKKKLLPNVDQAE
ncbi:MAG: 30S ribosomal protein S6--L-glutamate ligase [Armatimonadetes bacterium]|nr:30S ribosomal protein S6--L-glutamate ligase [Armatimonadota bacterium]MBS1710210.1 30S ribosomal protein S6--L-glutamate ligase [Armatimonadota bacterium]MBX3110100.1 30S ribosomal protein S6--L-glutamate ligase [Fimbriimonadaceae bacterium]